MRRLVFKNRSGLAYSIRLSVVQAPLRTVSEEEYAEDVKDACKFSRVKAVS